MTNSPWLHPLDLSSELHVGTAEFIDRHDNLSDWIAFCLWAGWWVHSCAGHGSRLYLVALLPARGPSAAIAALGACISSTRQEINNLGFPDFMKLRRDAPIYVKYRGRIVKGILGPPQRFDNQPCRRISLTTDSRDRIWVFEHNLGDYQVSTHPRRNLTRSRQQALERVDQFYSLIAPFSKRGWSSAPHKDLLLVTSKKRWYDALEGLVARASKCGASLELPLRDLLLPTEDLQGYPGRTMLSSPAGSVASNSGVRMAILDGPEALEVAGRVQTDASLILLEHSEFDEAAEQVIRPLVAVREEEALPTGVPSTIPHGIEVSVFGWHTD